MANVYDTQSVSGYNASAPPDDGTKVSANEIEWSKITDKIGDPLKTAIEALNTELVSSWQDLVVTVDTMSEMKGLAVGVIPSSQIFLRGHTTVGDGGGGPFIWDGSATADDDNGTIIQRTAGGVGRFLRLYVGSWVHAAWFGAFGSTKATAVGSLTNELVAIKNAVDNFLRVQFNGDRRYKADGTLIKRAGAAWDSAGGSFAQIITTDTTLALVKSENAGTGRTNDISLRNIAFFATTSFTGARLIDLRGVSRLYFDCEVSADVTTINGPLTSTIMVDNSVGFDDPFVDAGAFNVHQEFGPRTNIRGGKTGLLIQGNVIKWNNGISARHTEYGIQSDLLQNAVFDGGDISNNTLGGVRLINTTDGWVRGITALGVYHEGNGNRTAGQFSPNDWDIDTELLGEVYISRSRNQQPVNIKSFWSGAKGIQNADISEVMTGSGRVATQNVLENSDFSMVDAASTPANLPYGWAYSNGAGSDSAFAALSSGLPPGITSGIQITHSGSGAHSLEQTVTTIEGEAHSIFGYVWADGNVTDVRFGIKPNGGTNQLFSFETPDTDSTWYPVKIFYEAESGVTSIELGILGFTGPSGAVIKLCGFNGTRSAQNFADRHKPLTDAGGNVYGNLAVTDGKFAVPTSTTALLEDNSADVNTNAAKVQGSMVFNITTQAPVWSEGAADGSIWNDATGTTKHSPV